MKCDRFYAVSNLILCYFASTGSFSSSDFTAEESFGSSTQSLLCSIMRTALCTRSVYFGKSSAVFAVKRKRCRLVKYKFDVFAMSYCDKAVVLNIFTHH